MGLDSWWWIAGLAAFLVGLSKGGLPAVGTLGVPALSLVMSPVQAAALLLPIFVASDVVSVWLYRRHYSAATLRILVPAGLLGVVVGWLMASVVSDNAVKLLVGTIGVVFCLHTWLRKPVTGPAKAPQVGKGLLWGGLSGFTSFIAHAGAPPFQVYVLPQQLPKAVFAGTSTLFFAVINFAKIPPYQHLRPYSGAMLEQAAWLLPAALVGTLAGAYLTRRITDVWFYRLVQTGLFLMSLKLVYDALFKA